MLSLPVGFGLDEAIITSRLPLQSAKFPPTDLNTCYQYHSDLHNNLDQPPPPKTQNSKENQSKWRMALGKINRELCSMQSERIKLRNDVRVFQQFIFQEMRGPLQELMMAFKQQMSLLENVYAEKIQQQKVKVSYQRTRFELELEQHTTRLYELELAKRTIDAQELLSRQHIQELQDEIAALSRQNSHLQSENQELKDQLAQLHSHEATIQQYEDELTLLAQQLQQNASYISNLEQKALSHCLQISQKEKWLRQQYESSIKQFKENMELNFTTQFEIVQQQMRQSITIQIRQQVSTVIDQLKRQLQTQFNSHKMQREHFLEKISQLQTQNAKIAEAKSQLGAKVAQLSQLAAKREVEREEDRLRIQELLARAIEGDDRPNYYKAKVVRRRECDESLLDKSMYIQSAISPSSFNKKQSRPREEVINNILSRIRSRQEASLLQENSFELANKMPSASTAQPVSPESAREKDERIKNISSKLEQLRTDIRREIGMMKH